MPGRKEFCLNFKQVLFLDYDFSSGHRRVWKAVNHETGSSKDGCGDTYDLLIKGGFSTCSY